MCNIIVAGGFMYVHNERILLHVWCNWFLMLSISHRKDYNVPWKYTSYRNLEQRQSAWLHFLHSPTAQVCSCLSAIYLFIVMSQSVPSGTSVILQVNLIYWYLLKRRLFSPYGDFFSSPFLSQKLTTHVTCPVLVITHFFPYCFLYLKFHVLIKF